MDWLCSLGDGSGHYSKSLWDCVYGPPPFPYLANRVTQSFLKVTLLPLKNNRLHMRFLIIIPSLFLFFLGTLKY